MSVLSVSRPLACSFPRRFPRAGKCASLLAVLLLLAACATGRVATPGTEEQDSAETAPTTQGATVKAPRPAVPVPAGGVRVGLLLPLSGENAPLGEALLHAAELALFDVGVDELTLVVRDTESSAEGGARAAQSAMADGARLMLGPLFAGQVRPVAQATVSAGVNVVSFSTDRTVAGGGAYVMGVLPDIQVDRVAGYAVAQGYRRLGALVPNTPYGQAVVRALQASAVRLHVQLTRIGFYDPAKPDLSPEVRQFAKDIGAEALAAANTAAAAASGQVQTAPAAFAPGQNGLDIDALLLAEGGERLRIVAPLLLFYDVDPRRVKMLGTALWDDPRLAAEPALADGWFAAPPPDGWRAFAEHYRAIYGAAPPRLASLAYDAVTLAAALTRAGGPDPFGAAALTQPSGFAGVDGLFRFLPDGSVERGLAVLTVTRQGIKPVDPAPTNFVPLVN